MLRINLIKIGVGIAGLCCLAHCKAVKKSALESATTLVSKEEPVFEKVSAAELAKFRSSGEYKNAGCVCVLGGSTFELRTNIHQLNEIGRTKRWLYAVLGAGYPDSADSIEQCVAAKLSYPEDCPHAED